MKENLEILIKAKSNKGVLRLTMNNPDKKNPLSESMMGTLMEEIKDASLDKSVRVIVLASNGDVFSSGHDLKEITSARDSEDGGEVYFKELFDSCSSLMQLIVNTPKPVIAEIEGIATAAGCQLVASCDLAYSTNDALFATPGVNIGLFCSTPMVAVSRKINRKPMMKMLLTGEPIKANYAKEIGLINDYFSKSKLESEVLKVAKTIASKSNLTIKIGKQAFYKQLETVSYTHLTLPTKA